MQKRIVAILGIAVLFTGIAVAQARGPKKDLPPASPTETAVISGADGQAAAEAPAEIPVEAAVETGAVDAMPAAEEIPKAVAETPPPEPVNQGPSPEVIAEAKKRAAEAKKVIAGLDGSEWNITLKRTSGKKAGEESADMISFTGRKVKSRVLDSKGYPPSNISVTVGGEGVSIWETMQSNETGDVVFWRGEIRDDTMRGVMSKHSANGDPEDYSFDGNQAKAPVTTEQESVVE